MRLRCVALLVLALAASTSVQAQQNLRGGAKIRKPQTEVRTAPAKVEVLPDTLYSTQTRKQHGWLMPLDTISADCARHRYCSIRFTGRNAAGNWTKCETISWDGSYVPGTWRPYILNSDDRSYDINSDSLWMAKVERGSYVEYVSDITGAIPVQEQCFDIDGDIVYTFSRVPVGEGRYIGSYRDCYGLPAEMRQDLGYNYGTLVLITEDAYGYDSAIEFIDSKGERKPNADGVYRAVYEYDQDGILIRQMSQNAEGEPVKDNAGNCGIQYVWNDDFTIASATYMSPQWQPMSMPAQPFTTFTRAGVASVKFEYDEFKRMTAESYYDIFGRPVENIYGIHETRVGYNDVGLQTVQENLDLHGNLVEDSNGIARTECDYDGQMRLVELRWLDGSGFPLAKEGHLCRHSEEYDQAGNLVHQADYYIDNGEVTEWSREVHTPEFSYYYHKGSTCTLDSLDSKGRIICETFCDDAGNPTTLNGVARRVWTFADGHKTHSEIQKTYGEDGSLVDDGAYAVRAAYRDSAANMATYYYWDEDGRMVETYSTIFTDSTFSKIAMQVDNNAYGRFCRAGMSGSVRYYGAQIGYSQKGEFSTLIGRDEFGEPDYIKTGNGIYYYQKFKSYGSYSYDEDNEKVNSADLMDRVPKVMAIEVTDKSAYELGLQDNDVVLVFGDYTVKLQEGISDRQFKNEWVLRSVLDAGAPRRMVVFRIDSATHQCGLVQIDSLYGNEKDLGILAHTRYLTHRQTERITRAIEDNIASAHPCISREELARPNYTPGPNVILAASSDMTLNERNKLYGKNIGSPSILTCMCVPDKNQCWIVGDSTGVISQILDSRSGSTFFPDAHYYFALSPEKLYDLSFNAAQASVALKPMFISDEDLAQLNTVLERTKTMAEAELHKPSPYKNRSFYGKWHYEADGCDLQLTFSRGNKAHLSAIGQIATPFTEGTLYVDIKFGFDGSWRYKGNTLSVEFEAMTEGDMTFSRFDGADEQFRQKVEEYFKQLSFEEMAELSEAEKLFENLDQDFIIDSVSEDMIVSRDNICLLRCQ